MADKELLEHMREMTEAMDRVAKAQWLMFMATQNKQQNEVPTNAVYGSYNFNPTKSTTQLAAWRQLVPRNDRRKSITLMATNQTLFFTSLDSNIDITTLINNEANGFNGTMQVMEATLVAGVPLPISSTAPIYCASLTGGGSLIEQNAVIGWVEEIYASVTAIPVDMINDNPAQAGLMQRLTASDMRLDGDITGTFKRAGVR